MSSSTSPIQSSPVFERVQTLRDLCKKQQIKHEHVLEIKNIIASPTPHNEKLKNCFKPLNAFLDKNKAVIESAAAAIPYTELYDALDKSLQLFLKEHEKQSTKVLRKGSAHI